MGCSCGCNSDKHKTLVFACSGAYDVGLLSDEIARELETRDKAFMECLSGISAEIPEIIDYAKSAHVNVLIDGCHVNCVKKIFNLKNITNVVHFSVEDFGFKRDNTEITEDVVQSITDIIEKQI
jgi:uncharacterized metal-binding protein